MSESPPLPRWSLAFVAAFHAVVFGLSAAGLPWAKLTPFAFAAGAAALGHASVALFAVLHHRWLERVWRVSSFVSLAFLAYVTYAALSSGIYVARLYDGVGNALAAAAGAAWCIVAAFTIPIASWGLAKTGGLWRRKRGPRDAGPLVVSILVIAVVFGAATRASRARGVSVLPADTGTDEVRRVISTHLDDLALLPAPPGDPSLFTQGATVCSSPPEAGGATIFASYLDKRAQPAAKCFQGDDLDHAAQALEDELAQSFGGGAIAIDVVRRAQALPDAGPILGAIILRPGKDGVCLESSCLAPWQVVAADQFTKLSSFSALGTKMGLASTELRKGLGEPAGALPNGFAGLTRIETESFVRLADGTLDGFTRMRRDPPPLDRDHVLRATKGALAFIVSAQDTDGRFRYLVDPFTGEASFADFAVPRQAGTTLALCEAGALDDRSRETARKSLTMLASLERSANGKGGIVYPKGTVRSAPLGSTALTMIALLGCRPRVGKSFDGLIGRLGANLLASQRPDGGFAPGFDVDKGQADKGKDPLYAEGQAVLALVLWEGARDLGAPKEITRSIDRAMDHFSGPYWNTPLHDFFYIEENWHCLAARAALTTGHRHDAYERFCIDYMTMKKRLELDRTSAVADDAIGGYGFGNVIPPYHAATAGFAESLAAEMAVRRARGLPVDDDARVLSESLAYLVRHQWTDENCFFCTRKLRIPGAFSENVGSPVIRIDYVQHSMAALAHGGRELGLMMEGEVDGPV